MKKEPLKTTIDEKPNSLIKRLRLVVPVIIIICIVVFAWIIINPEVVAEKIEAQFVICRDKDRRVFIRFSNCIERGIHLILHPEGAQPRTYSPDLITNYKIP